MLERKEGNRCYSSKLLGHVSHYHKLKSCVWPVNTLFQSSIRLNTFSYDVFFSSENKNPFKNLNSLNLCYQLLKNLFRLNWGNLGSYSLVFTAGQLSI